MNYCHVLCLSLVAFFSTSASASSFYACQVEAKLKKVSEELQSNDTGEGLLLEMTFEPSKVTEGECGEVMGKTLTRDVAFNHKDSLYALKMKAEKNETIELDHSYYSGESHDGESMTIETWSLLGDDSNYRLRGDNGRYR